ncbi:MAG: 50S ribosomal protein L3 [Thioploca sp.]|nr:50S ribosomal protein L3 [Thioploca sp.]
MALGIIGRKRGMTRMFTEAGTSIPVTVVEAPPNRVTQLKTPENEGYRAIQVTCGSRRLIRVNKPQSGHFAKSKLDAGRGLWEFRLNEAEAKDIQVGSQITVTIFTNGQKVDVAGLTKGKGFAGTVKRHHFSTQDMTHGNSLSHRAPGSIGQNQTPGRVFKGKRMAGHMGHVRRTILNLEIAQVDVGRNLLLIKGAVPGAPGDDVVVRPAIKVKGKK